MADLAEDLIGEIRLGRGGRGRFRNTSFGKARRGRAGGSLFSAQARNLWRVAQGSNAAVLKKINRGGTHTGARLAAQFDYLFSKSEAVFGNMVELEPGTRGLSADQRRDIAQGWSDAWFGEAKNGHTTHLLLSFPADLSPRKALRIAEAWAFEMFQSGAHVEDEWAYVAALHTDRAHPHVHIVVNNRGLEQGQWFYMAKEHEFNLAMMKERLVELAADMGVELDTLYTADVTRTLPINGTFTETQRKIYDAVYAAQEAGIAAVKPGATIAMRLTPLFASACTVSSV